MRLRTTAAMAALFVFAGLTALPVRAVTVDNGWTQSDNGKYPAMGVASCYPNCEAWTPGRTITVGEDSNVPFHPQEESYSITRWNNARWYLAVPVMSQCDSCNPYANVTGIMSPYVGGATCAVTQNHWLNQSPDGRSQHTIVSSNVYYAAATPWVVGGFKYGQCDMGIVKTHEFGHSHGLGHTNWNGQLMYPSEQLGVYSPQGGDTCGVNKIYVQSAPCN